MDKVVSSTEDEKHKRVRFLNNQASKRFRLKRRTEKESVNVSRVVLQSVNGILRQREKTLIQLKQILHQACLNGETKEVAYKNLQEEIQKDANMDISNQRLIRESVKLRTVPIITIAECEGLDAIFKRPMKKGPGIMSQVKDDALLELMEVMEKSNRSKSPIEAPKSPIDAIHVPVIESPPSSRSENIIPVPRQTKTNTFLSKRDLPKKEHCIKSLLSQVNFSVDIIPISKNVPRRILPQPPIKPDVSITLVDAKPQTVLMPRTPMLSSNNRTRFSKQAVSPPVFYEKNSLLGGKRKSAVEIFPQTQEKKCFTLSSWFCPTTLPSLTISRVKTEPSGMDMLFPISRDSHPDPSQIVEVSKDAAILWNINVAESNRSEDCIKVEPVDSDPVETFIKPKLEKEDYVWS